MDLITLAILKNYINQVLTDIGIDGYGIKNITQTVDPNDSQKNIITITLTNGKKQTLVILNGEQGKSGVYVGTGEMPDGYNIQIDPSGDAVALLTEAEKQEIVDAVLDEIPTVETAEVGQTIIVKAVDENGKPTEWEAADFPSGTPLCTDWEFINEVTISFEDEVFRLVIDSTSEGEAFEYDELFFDGDGVQGSVAAHGLVFTNGATPYQGKGVSLQYYFASSAQANVWTFLKIMANFNRQQISQVTSSRGAACTVWQTGSGAPLDKYTSFGIQTGSETVFMAGHYTLYGRNYK